MPSETRCMPMDQEYLGASRKWKSTKHRTKMTNSTTRHMVSARFCCFFLLPSSMRS